jgi:hypothetical protein
MTRTAISTAFQAANHRIHLVRLEMPNDGKRSFSFVCFVSFKSHQIMLKLSRKATRFGIRSKSFMRLDFTVLEILLSILDQFLRDIIVHKLFARISIVDREQGRSTQKRF